METIINDCLVMYDCLHDSVFSHFSTKLTCDVQTDTEWYL